MTPRWEIRRGDAREELKKLDDESIQCCVTSPPFWGLRDYNAEGQIGLESTPQEYVENLVEIFEEVRRVLRGDGTLWLNLGDTYASNKGGSTPPENSWEADDPENREARRQQKEGYNPSRDASSFGMKGKDLIGIPWMVAFALRDQGWWLRSDIIWRKKSPMPESVKDRPTNCYEHIFLLAKSKYYYYDQEAIQEPTAGQSGWKNKRDVWEVKTASFPDTHFAVYPPELIRPCIKAGSAEGDRVLDPFAGAGTTVLEALRLGREGMGIELSEKYVEMSRERIRDETPPDPEENVEENPEIPEHLQWGKN